MMEVDLDANNNSTDKKGYSLRPRCAPKSTDSDEISEEVRKPRSRISKSLKQKCLPLSKYRRKTANARERSRMREINEAFETLRRSIPLISTKIDNPNEKNTKISTLRLAMKYITVLSTALRDSDGESDKDSIFSEYTLTPPDYRDSYTPTSPSENSDFSDSFFGTNLSHESSSSSLSPFSNSSSFNLVDIAPNSKPHSWSTSEKSNYKVSTLDCDGVQQRIQRVEENIHEVSPAPPLKSPPSYEIARLSTLKNVVTLNPLPTTTPQLPTLDLRFADLTPISLQLQSAPVIDDWDDISFPRVDFDELLCT